MSKIIEKQRNVLAQRAKGETGIKRWNFITQMMMLCDGYDYDNDDYLKLLAP